MFERLFQSITIRNKTIKNRFCCPPYGMDIDAEPDTGIVAERKIRFYEEIARGGTGLIIMGYTAVQKDGRARVCQPGLWDDSQIEPFRGLADRLHKYGAVVIPQLHHGGAKVPTDVCPDIVSPSPIESHGSRAMTLEEVHQLRDDFISAAVRAKKAGLDGVELHAAHCYLLSQFSSPLYNHREDPYGGSLENRMRLQTEIIRGIRAACSDDFIVGARIGGNDPGYEEGIEKARLLEAAGADYLSISFGMDDHYNMDTMYWLPTKGPEGFPYNTVVYSASLIKKAVSIPIIAVRSICTPERGEWLLENGHADLIAYGRPHLTNPDFVSRIQQGTSPATECLDCPACRWFTDPNKCPIMRKYGRDINASD